MASGLHADRGTEESALLALSECRKMEILSFSPVMQPCLPSLKHKSVRQTCCKDASSRQLGRSARLCQPSCLAETGRCAKEGRG